MQNKCEFLIGDLFLQRESASVHPPSQCSKQSWKVLKGACEKQECNLLSLLDARVPNITTSTMKHIFFSICLMCLSVPLLGEIEVGEVEPDRETGAERKDESMLTIANLDSYFDMMKMFRGMLPKDLMSTIDSLNITEKGELVAFLSDWYHGRIKKPENKAEIVELIKDKLPTVYEKIDALNTTFYEKFLKLKPETQELLRSWRDKAIELEGETAAESAAKRLQFLRDVALSVQTMNNETKEDIRSQFPLAVNLTEGFGFTVFTTMAMIVQKIMEGFGAQGAATVAPQDCAVPMN
ncbi:unnamed protein product [Cylicocyclus nassatus]|uniref:Uncharacterized protein n=1 Tax=Cylicocyclus nassatus TaxID=53992 RepID=A0AA36M2X9_CYLNA|nr:unnamed protein product [Cylicocyclus nassatus]